MVLSEARVAARQTEGPTLRQPGERMRNTLVIFGQLTDDDVVWLAETGAPQRLAVGVQLVEEGTPVQFVYLLLDGEVKVTTGQNGQTDVARLRAGDMIGEMSFVDASPPSASVTTTIDSMVLEIPRHALEQRLQTDSGFASRFFRALAMLLSDRLRQTMDRFKSKGQNAAENALAIDELDPNVLEVVTRAGERFERLLKASREKSLN